MLPLLRAMLGASRPLPIAMSLTLGAELAANGGRRAFLRASWNGEVVIANAVQDSGALASLATSNMLIDRPATATPAAAGETVRGFWLGNGGIA
jgi:molybdopterin molybdotransferase